MGPRATIAAYVATGIALAMPVALVTVPPLVDYPNHLARVHVRTEDASQVYEAVWALLPNLAMDLVHPVLNLLASPYVAGQVFILFCVLLPFLGTAALYRVLNGRVGVWPLASALLVYNHALAWGFLNWVFTSGLALIALAGWLAAERWRWPWRVAVFSLVATVLFFGHLAALGFYGLCVVAHRAWQAHKGLGQRLDWAAALAQFAIPALLWLIWRSGDAATLAGTDYGTWAHRIRAALSPTLFYGGPFDIASLLLLALAIVGGLLAGALRLNPTLHWPLAAVTVVALLLPHNFRGLEGVDFRLPAVVLCLLVAGLRPTGKAPQFLRVMAVALIAVGIGRIADIAQDWRAMDRDYEAFRRAAETLEPGSRLLVAMRQEGLGHKDAGGRAFAPAYWHMDALAVIDRDIFTPVMMTEVGVHTLRPRSSYAALSAPRAGPICRRDVIAGADPSRPRAEILAASCQSHLPKAGDYWVGWPAQFDALLWIHFGEGDNPLPKHLEAITDEAVFSLYRVIRP